jgi:hypothetical protein
MSLTTDNMHDVLRPIFLDAAESLSFGGYVDVEVAMAWFDRASVEALQEVVMYAVQRGVLFALDIAPLPDMDGVPTLDE